MKSKPLETDDRESFLGYFAPPTGYVLDAAIGTTYSLDLEAFLLVPVAAARGGEDSCQLAKDPLVLIDALRRASDRVAVFCQTGGIKVPPKDRIGLLPFLESRTVDVSAAQPHASFHPKVWVLRFIREKDAHEDGIELDENPILLRLLVLTRNLTFDRSWDLVVSFEGPPRQGAVNGYSNNAPLRDFIAALPNSAVRPEAMAEGIKELCASIAAECYRVPEWTAPEGFELEAFHATGLRPGRGVLGVVCDDANGSSGNRGLVISPFLGDSTLAALKSSVGALTVVSRADSLVRLESNVDATSDIEAFAFADVNDIEPSDESLERVLNDGPDSLVDLHAKLLVVEHGAHARWFLGSANATPSGLGGRNVEFMVELSGKKKEIGIDALIGDRPEDKYSLRRMLVPWHPENATVVEETSDAERALDEYCAFLSRLRLFAVAEEDSDGMYSLKYGCEKPTEDFDTLGGFSIRPLSLDAIDERPGAPLLCSSEVVFENLSRDALTPLVALSVKMDAYSREFVLSIPVSGMPKDRLSKLVASLIKDEKSFLRFIQLLLGEDLKAFGKEGALDGKGAWNGSFGAGFDLPLFEALLNAAAEEPEKLHGIARLLRELEEGGANVVPAEFSKLWSAVAEVVGVRRMHEEVPR